MRGGFRDGHFGGAPVAGSGFGRGGNAGGHRHARVGPFFAYPGYDDYGYDAYSYDQCLVYDRYSGRWINYCYN